MQRAVVSALALALHAGQSEKSALVLAANVDGIQVPLSHDQTLLDSDCVQAFPTASRVRRQERERAAKAAGKPLVVQKKFKVIEDHFDDCGEDVSKLGNIEDPVVFVTSDWDQDADPTVEMSSTLCIFAHLILCTL